MPAFNRHDICGAYLALENDYNMNGVLRERRTCQRRRESVGVQLHRMKFVPGPGFDGFKSLSFNGKDIYANAVDRLKLPLVDNAELLQYVAENWDVAELEKSWLEMYQRIGGYYLVSVTETKISEEDVELGEGGESEYVVRDEWMTESELKSAAENYSIDEPSSSHPRVGAWFSSSGTIENSEHFEEGIRTEYSLHVSAVKTGIYQPGRDPTEDDMLKIGRMINARFSSDRPERMKG